MTQDHQRLRKDLKPIFLVVGLVIFFCDGVIVAQHAPFFPTAAEEKGSSETWVGIITGAFDVSAVICLVLLRLIVGSAYCRGIFLLATVLCGISCMCFAFTIKIKENWIFNFICLSIRILMGAASCIVWVNGMSIFIGLYSKQSGLVTGTIQSAYGTGIILGPMTGSLLFGLGGFKLPFLVSGSLQILFGIICSIFMKIFTEEPANEDCEKTVLVHESPNVNNEKIFSNATSAKDFIKFATNWRIILVNVSYFLNGSSLGYLDVAIGIHLLKSFSIDGDVSGYIFLSFSLGLCFSTIAAGKLTDLGYGDIIYLMSSAVGIIAFFLLFLPNIVPKLQHVALVIVSLSLCGTSHGMALTVLQITKQTALLYGLAENVMTENVLTFFHMTAFAGHMFGSAVIGGLVLDALGYYWSNLAISIMFVLGLLSTLLVLSQTNIPLRTE